jgi:hypothetical protein
MPMGHFYSYCNIAVPRTGIKSVLDVRATDWIQYHVTANDCSHLSRSYVEQMKRDLPGGEAGVAFQSIVMAEFGSADQMVVIPSLYVWKAVIGSRYGWKQKPYNNAGLDLSDGGDETVLCIRNGNRLLHVLPFKFDNTQDTIRYLDEKFRAYGLNNPQSTINADCGGLGKPILDSLRAMGWSNIKYIDNRNTPREPRTYKNRAAELWFSFRKLLETNDLWLLDDKKTKEQLATRFYTVTDNKHQLESKINARSRGHPSPDRADAVILAFWDYESLTPNVKVEKPFLVNIPEDTSKMFTIKEYSTREDKPKYTRTPTSRQHFSVLQELVAEHNELQRSIESS